MRLGSLFSGYGGLDMAVEAVTGAELAWVSDIDPGACTILAHRYPDVPNLGDITAIDWSTVEPVDVLTGGFPCQDVSHAGRRAGLIRGETRTGLWANMLTAIDKLRPSLVVAENVRGLLSARADSDLEPCPWCLGDEHASPLRALGAVLGDLADIGYDASWVGLRAADVGAAHGRFRVFIAAHPRGEHGVQRWLAAAREAQGGRPLGEPTGRDRTPVMLPTPRATRGGSATETVALLPTPMASDQRDRAASDAWAGHDLVSTVKMLPTPRATDREKGGPNQRGSAGDLMLPSAVHLLPTPSVADTMGGHHSRSGDRSDELLLNGIAHHNRWGDYAAAIARAEVAAGRPAPPPTMPGPKGGPRLNPEFVEWLMLLPAGHVTGVPGLTRNQQLKALGNGVVPAQAEAALRWLLGQEEWIAA